MKKIFIPIALALFIFSCKGTDGSTTSNGKNTEGKLSACECAEIYNNSPTMNIAKDKEDMTEEDRVALTEKWAEMWEPCKHFDGNMTEVLKCARKK